ncbi:helicase and polymerase-containing protein TEBICHI isoform X2 [Hevea brasiliensis]|uniref:helicase and polymerase-containing protein TEBICHI isoform X2 n=1 Tax=Hevea brasiliensis TaxID=3981 RepID=UPI0025F5FC9A|nr:helicase and polymerase-containing protein TEBICHI isoform X2 [Hevea brasiliensis]
MASDPPRTRIDQFFASKKRKSRSPGLKSGRVEKDGRTTSEGSSSAKGTLDNYLVNSQDPNHGAKLSSMAWGLLARQDSVKRNLALEINNISKEENKGPFLVANMDSQTSKGFEAVKRETSQGSSNAGNVAFEGLAKGFPVSNHSAENLEIKQFANDFLSLYCELQSTATSPSKPKLNDNKRNVSQLLNDEGKTLNKRHCISIVSHSGGETVKSMDNKTENKQSAFTETAETPFTNASWGITFGNDPSQLAASLRKCTRASKSIHEMTECCTPGSSIVRASVSETPMSMRGSSMFSPGEAFWNEAIQIVDGLFADAGNPLALAAEDVINGSCCDKARQILDEASSRGQQMQNGGFLELNRTHMSDSTKVSPLPVKHLDFLFDDKNLDATSPCCASDNSNVHKGFEQSERGSVNVKSSRTVKIATYNEAETKQEMRGVDGIVSVHAVTKSEAYLSNQDTGSITSNSPVQEVRVSIANNGYGDAGTPSSFVLLKDQLDLGSWLPSEVCSIYKKRGISKLYAWQVDCLQVEGVLQRRNLVYCASTSAGKSFVAEILMLRRVILTSKIALLVLPYVSICAEKAEHLEGLLEPLGKHVRSYYGSQGGGTLPKDTSVAVCTIEKANSLINRLLEEGRLSEIGIIVIDELHMVGDQSRGYLLELMLTKLRYAAGEGNSESSSGESSGTSSKGDPAHGMQIVGMSATMPNVAAVADWLQAALYQTDFRPVPLEEFIKVGNTIYDKKMDIVRTIPKAADLGGKDPDHIVELCNEVVQEGHSVLIFCSSRKGCESTAKHISKFLKKFTVNIQNDSEFLDISSAIDALRRCPVGLDPTLEETLPSGVAYHHAGLTVEEREIIESCYRRGLLRVLTATSTLAAGVNLPARRVIFRQPRIGRDFIDGTRYRQMAGRAGRTGIDTKGESILICKPEELKRIMGLLNESCPPLQSCLSEDKNGMTHAILEVVAGGIVQTANDIHRYVRCTLLNSTKPFRDVVKSAQDSLRWLCHRKFLEWCEDTKLYSTTSLGRAAFGSSFCPEESLIVLDDLSRAREGFVLASDLHLVYLVTPINVEVEPDWELYYERFMELSSLDKSVGNRVGVLEPFLMRMAHGAPMRTLNKSTKNMKELHGKLETRHRNSNNNMISEEQSLRVCKRFYVALILSRLVQVSRGMVQALQENSGRFASMVSLFCERLGWHDLEGLVAKFQNRVSFGVRAEIVELTTIPYVKGSRARSLYKAGLRTPLAIAEASVSEIVKALFESTSWAAQEGSAQRRMQLGVAKKIKNGARKIVLDKAEEARAAAFSAFKSLGLNVPQFSQPSLTKACINVVEQVDASKLSGEDTTNVILCLEQRDHASSDLCIEGSKNSAKVTLGSGEKLMKTIDVGLVAPAEVNSAGLVEQNCGAANSTLPVEKSLTLGTELHTTSNQNSNAIMVLSVKPGQDGDGDGAGINDRSIHYEVQDQCSRENLCGDNMDSTCEKSPINASNTPGGFDSFLALWDNAQEFYFDLHYNKRSEVNSITPFEIHGMAICWENSPVYYVNLPKDLVWSENHKNVLPHENWLEMVRHRWNRIGEIMGKKEVKKFTWNLKIQIQVLKKAAVSIQRFGSPNLSGKSLDIELLDNSHFLLSPVNIKEGIDMCVVAWILWPDEERSSNPNLEKEVKKRLPSEAVAAANRKGRWKNQMRRAAHNGCCRRVAQTRALCSVLWKLLISEGLFEPLNDIEIPLVNVLAEMELWGIGVDMEGCLQARKVLGKKLRHLEQKAYELAGMTFSLYTAADVANVLYEHLKLPIPEGGKGKQHPSTDKHCLDLLRNEHPIIPVIREHRTLAKLLNCTLGSICSLARISMRTQKHTLHGHWLQTSTSTGRLSMEEPNLQCVEHMVEFRMSMDENGRVDDGNHYKINARDFFVPTQENWLLLTADYSQIELRLMAHFSKDASLIELLSNPCGDVFTMMAARWTGKPEDSVASDERDQTKRLVYGILYGMGANTLAEQLNCSSEEAAEKIKSFKGSFPGVASWLHEAVDSCRKNGYVETLKGRKRFLSKIKFGNSKEKSKAQRQAVNSICQGSAADIIKIAMINIYSVIVRVDGPDSSSSLATKFHMLKGQCRILLQVHDELVLEIDHRVIKEAASLLQISMENAASLLVPLQVKLKVGRTWGSLEPYEVDQCKNEVLVLDS